MSVLNHVRRQQILREAEGYLDLAMACADQLPLSENVREQLARRILDTLAMLDNRRGNKARVEYLTGQALRVRSQYQEAIEHLRSAADLDSDSLATWLALGWCYKRSGRLDLAIEALEEALELDHGEGIVFYNLACYWSLANNSKHALRYLTHAFDLDPALKDLVATEHDFDPIRSDPKFLELTSVIV